VLQQRLTSGTTRAAVAALHGRASIWYERHWLIAEAVQHALAAADGERAARLIEQHGLLVIVRGQVHTALGWLNGLPDALIRARPRLCTIHATALLLTKQLEAAEAVSRIPNAASSATHRRIRGTAAWPHCLQRG
jgi:LuxR family maltose regulon positive regulatory protein